MILGIDLGASSTDFVLFGEKPIESKSMQAIELSELSSEIKKLNFPLKKVDLIALTGGKSSSARDSFHGIPVKKVNEINAIGCGGLFVSGEKRALIASMGTGTCLVKASEKRFEHLGGTGVSGGTLLGLSKRLLGTVDLNKINSLAEKGDLSRVDLKVKDIVGRGIGNLPPNATASNFARLKKVSKKDLALGIINLIAETNAVTVSLAAEKCECKKIVLTGKLSSIPVFHKRLLAGFGLLGKKAVFPKNYDIATAIGGCVFAQTI